MLLLFLWLLYCTLSNGEHSFRCGSGDELSFMESQDGVHARYQLEWCMQVDKSIKSMGQSGQWVVSLLYDSHCKPEDCQKNKSDFSDSEHSYFIEDVTIDLNCTNVCLTTNFDLIFNGTCYTFKTHLKSPRSSKVIRTFKQHENVTYVYNNYSKDTFTESQTAVIVYNSGDYVTARWFLHLVPATNYTIVLCPTFPMESDNQCVEVTRNCSTSTANRTRIQCELWPPAEPYTLRLTHNTPWANGGLFAKIRSFASNQTMYTKTSTPLAVTPPASSAPWWALGGALALALGGAAALLACRSHLVRKLHERVQLDWQTRSQAEEVAKPASGGGRVLLLYARDCAPMMAVASQLRVLLRHSVDHVYDLYSAEVVREAARAPAEWVRRALAAADVRVLLLQSPAAAALHGAAVRAPGAGHALALERPLLNRRVGYRAPHSSDCLLPLALRLLADTAYTTHSYKKFYVATIAGLEAELVREVTPLRRYSLPAAAELLLRDLGDGAALASVQLEAELQRFHKVVQDLHNYVRANPDYLDDELIFFDYD